MNFWDLEQALQKPPGYADGHIQKIKNIEFLNDKECLTWSDDNRIIRWTVGQSDILTNHFVYRGHESEVRGVYIYADKRRALSWSVDGVLLLWDLSNTNNSTNHTAFRKDEQNYCKNLRVIENGKRAIMWGRQLFTVFDIENKAVAPVSFKGHKSEILDVSVINKGKNWISVSKTSEYLLWDADDNKSEPELFKGPEKLKDSFLLHDNNVLNFGSSSTIYRFPLNNEFNTYLNRHFLGHEGEVLGVKLYNNNRQFVSWSEDGTIRLWDLEGKHEDSTVFEDREEGKETASPRGITWLREGKSALSWNEVGEVTVWDLLNNDNKVNHYKISGFKEPITMVEISPDQNRALAVSGGKRVVVFDLIKKTMEGFVLFGSEMGDIETLRAIQLQTLQVVVGFHSGSLAAFGWKT